MKVEFKGLDSCKPRDLIRIKRGDRTEWALVGSPGNSYLPLLVLSSDGVPRAFNAVGDMGLKQEFEQPVLFYGQDYLLLPNHAGPCDIVPGASSAAVGSLIQSTSGLFLVGDFVERKNKTYYDVATGQFKGEPGGSIGIFSDWALWLSEGGKPSVLVVDHQPKPAAKKAAAA